jgi:uncharacterized membrane protein
MNASQVFIVLSIAVLAVIAALVFLIGRGGRETRLTPLAALAFACVVGGIVFGGDRVVGYSLMGIGVLLAVVDIVRKSRGE